MKQKIITILFNLKQRRFLPKWFKNKYILTSIFFIVWLLFIDNDSFYIQYQLNNQLRSLNNQKASLLLEIQKTKKQIEDFKNNNNLIEKYARENYLLKRDNEVLFIYEKKDKEKNNN